MVCFKAREALITRNRQVNGREVRGVDMGGEGVSCEIDLNSLAESSTNEGRNYRRNDRRI